MDDEAAAETAQKPRASHFDRPRFAAEKLGVTPTQRGTAHQLVMQYIDFDRTGTLDRVKAEIERLVSFQYLTPEQGEAVDPEKIYAFFRSDLGREALSSPTLRREFKFSVLEPADRYFPEAGGGEQVLLQGVVDCYFETPEGIVVVDFKTDRVTPETVRPRAEGYRPQLEAYAQALSEIAGRPVARRALWFFATGESVEV